MLLFLIFIYSSSSAQVLTKYDQFELKEGDLIWQNTYQCRGNKDSLHAPVVQMLKSKFYTFNVVRNEVGYNGELRHYHVDCKRYGRSYFNTPRIYCDGEWTGKFIVEINDHSYKVTVYALYYESVIKIMDYYRSEREIKGRYLDAVTKKNKTAFQKGELRNISLMSFSLKEEFTLSKTSYIN